MSRKALEQKMAVEVGGRVNLNPPPPPPKEEIEIPDFKELIPSKADQLKLARMVQQQYEIGQQEKQFSNKRKPLTEAIKLMLGTYKIGKMFCNGLRVSYITSNRVKLDEHKLYANLVQTGLDPDEALKVIDASRVIEPSTQLRIWMPGDRES